MIYKKLENINYARQDLLDVANSLNYSDGYAELGRKVPQQVHSAFNMDNPLIKNILDQFVMPKIFYSCSFIRTEAHSVVGAHEDSAAGTIRRTVNILFPLDNYNTPLDFYIDREKVDSVLTDCPTAFDCSVMHGYENNTDGWRSAFILQCKYPHTFQKLISVGAF
jgi:hypothetical protein